MVVRRKTEKLSVTLPSELAAEIRSITSSGEVSSFFTKALTHYLAYQKQELALKQGFGVWQDHNHPELNNTQDSVDYINNLRANDQVRLKGLKSTHAR